MEIRDATKADLEQWWGGPLQRTCKAIVADDGGKVVGLAGLSMFGDFWFAFSEFDPEKITKRCMVVARRRYRELLRSTGGRIMARPEETLQTPERFLRGVGFVKNPEPDPEGNYWYEWIN